MKIIKTYDKTVGKTEYYKYRAPLPKKVAEDSGLIDKELKITTKNKKIVIVEEKDKKEQINLYLIKITYSDGRIKRK